MKLLCYEVIVQPTLLVCMYMCVYKIGCSWQCKGVYIEDQLIAVPKHCDSSDYFEIGAKVRRIFTHMKIELLKY